MIGTLRAVYRTSLHKFVVFRILRDQLEDLRYYVSISRFPNRDVLRKERGLDLKHFWRRLLSEKPKDIASLFNGYALDDESKKTLFKKYVQIINIETSTYCNRKCSYCPVGKPPYHRATQSSLDIDAYRKIILQLKEIDYAAALSLNLYNEPMADDLLVEKIRFARQHLPKSFIKFNSNGDFLDSTALDEMADAGVSAIFVTLHPAKGKTYDDNDRLKHFNKFFRRLKREATTVVNPSTSIRAEFFHKKMHIIVMADNWGEFGNDRAGTVTNLSKLGRTAPCARPFREFVVAHDGFVYPCCQFFPDAEKNVSYRVGHVNETNIFNLYASQLLSSFRRDLFGFGTKQPPCDSCADADDSTPTTAERRSAILGLLQ